MESRTFTALLVCNPSGIAAGQDGGQKLDADRQSHHEVAEAEMAMDEQWNHRQRQSDCQIAKEKCGNNARCRAGKQDARGVILREPLNGEGSHVIILYEI